MPSAAEIRSEYYGDDRQEFDMPLTNFRTARGDGQRYGGSLINTPDENAFEFTLTRGGGSAAPKPEVLPVRGPRVVTPEPERTFTTVEETETYKALQNVKKVRSSMLVSCVLLIGCIVLGALCIVRYASIFDLTRHTRNLVRENTKARNQLVIDTFGAEGEAAGNVESVAAKLGMVRPSEDSKVSIELSGSDVTRVFLEPEEKADTEADAGFYESLMAFLGRVDYK